MVEVRSLATDAVIVLDWKVVLLERAHSPFEGGWVLPGGLVELDETAREACVREVNEEVGLDLRSRSSSGSTTTRVGTSEGTSVRRTDVRLSLMTRRNPGRKPDGTDVRFD